MKVMAIDTAGFKAAMNRYQKATNKEMPIILNHWATQAAFRAAQRKYTPAARKSKQLGAAANPLRPRKKWKYEHRLYYALAQKTYGVGNRRNAEKIYAGRRQSVGFISINWNAALNELGLQRSMRLPKKKSDVRVSRATRYKLEVSLYNAKLEGKGKSKAQSTLAPGWARAQRDAIHGKGGMVPYANKKIKDHWKKAGRAGAGFAKSLLS
jgi:hypothetical protein